MQVLELRRDWSVSSVVIGFVGGSPAAVVPFYSGILGRGQGGGFDVNASAGAEEADGDVGV